MPKTRVNDVEIYWEKTGVSGEPLILVHGGWGDHTGWNGIVPLLANSFRVYTYDRRGHSQSERPEGQGSIREDVADLVGMLEMLDIAPAHIVGNSFGASIVLRMANEESMLCRSVIVHEPPLYGVVDDPRIEPTLNEALRNVELASAQMNSGDVETGCRTFFDQVIGPGAWDQLPEEVRQCFVFNAPTFIDEVADPDWFQANLGKLAESSVPLLLTQGNVSPAFLMLIADRLGLALPNAITQTLDGMGHGPQATHPEEYAKVIENFIAQYATE